MSTQSGAQQDVALAVWSLLVRAVGPFGVRVDPMVLALLRDMRASGGGVFTPEGLLRAELVDGLAAMVEGLRAFTGGPGPSG